MPGAETGRQGTRRGILESGDHTDIFERGVPEPQPHARAAVLSDSG